MDKDADNYVDKPSEKITLSTTKKFSMGYPQPIHRHSEYLVEKNKGIRKAPFIFVIMLIRPVDSAS